MSSFGVGKLISGEVNSAVPFWRVSLNYSWKTNSNCLHDTTSPNVYGFPSLLKQYTHSGWTYFVSDDLKTFYTSASCANQYSSKYRDIFPVCPRTQEDFTALPSNEVDVSLVLQ